ncbi:MAG: HEAT repeat domain-containing protein [Candidatus Brocadiae bacterium]|nr:HEAT repeat domain-containing protein [Candidatus Brocadiia bacterium]
MHNGVKVGIVLALGGLGYGAWKLYVNKLGSKSESELFEMVAAGGARGSAGESELTLRASSGKTAVGVFRGRLTDPSPAVRILACRILGSQKDKDAAKGLLALLQDPKEDAEVKEAVCGAFVKIRVKEAVPPLLAHLDYTSETVRVAASEALRSITGQAYSNKEPDKWREWWESNKATFVVKE